MFVLPLIICILTLAFAILAGFINGYLVAMVFWIRRNERKADLALIYARFCVDVVYDLCCCGILGNMIWSFVTAGRIRQEDLIFLTAWPNFNLGSVRVMLVVIITLERTLAACFPVKYHNYRSKVSLSAISTFILTYIILLNTGFFYLCDFYFLNDPAHCDHFGCEILTCYYFKWILSELVMYLVIGLLTVILGIRLFIWNHCTGAPKNANLTRANRLAILDVFIIFVFDLIPSYIFAHFAASINSISVGPIMFMSKNLGFVIESLVICRILLWRCGKSKQNPSTIVSHM